MPPAGHVPTGLGRAGWGSALDLKTMIKFDDRPFDVEITGLYLQTPIILAPGVFLFPRASQL
jgi:hypothetical protein